jgi:hypothetical protein
LICTVAMARNTDAPATRTRITDDNSKLTIEINRSNGGQPVHYQCTFSVVDMNWIEKDLLKLRVFTAQEIAIPFHEIAGLMVLVGGGLILALSLMGVSYKLRTA